MSHVDHPWDGVSLADVSSQGHKGFKGRSTGEVPVDEGLALAGCYPGHCLVARPRLLRCSTPHGLLPSRTYPHVSCGRYDPAGMSRLVVRRSTGMGSAPELKMRRVAVVDDDGTFSKRTVASRSGSGARRSGWIVVGIDHLVGRSKRRSKLASRGWLELKWIHDSIYILWFSK